MKEIILTQGKMALVDDDVYEKLNGFKWFAAKQGNTFYAHRHSPMINGSRYMITMHHEVIGKPKKPLQTDHKNGNGLDNQRKNLRHVTCRQNGQNRRNQNKSSVFPGICWFKEGRKWMVQIEIDGVHKYLGLFTDEHEAYKIYCDAVHNLEEKCISK